MTVKELSKLYRLNREVELNMRQLERLEAERDEDERLLQELRQTMGNVSSPILSDMPKVQGVGNPTESAVLRVMQLESNIQHKHEAVLDMRVIISTRQTLCLLERKRLEEYINTVDDSLLRQIFTLRFVNGLPWDQVAFSIGKEYKGETARKLCYRYLKQHKDA